jgi:hypothetical protein
MCDSTSATVPPQWPSHNEAAELPQDLSRLLLRFVGLHVHDQIDGGSLMLPHNKFKDIS